MMSQIDYCNVIFIGAITNKLQQVLNAAARVVSGTRKFDRGLTQLLHTNLYRLNVKYNDAPMPGRHCSTVSDSTLYTSLRFCVMTVSLFGCQPSTDSFPILVGHIWWSGVCCRRSVDVELTAETFMRSFYQYFCFWSSSQNFFFSEY